MINRFDVLVKNKQGKAPIVTAWKHFVEDENDYVSLAKKTVDFQEKYQWDLVKVNPRATYYAEAFGNLYDKTQYTDVLPKLLDYPIKNAQDLVGFTEKLKVDYAPFAEQVLLVKRIRRLLGNEIPMFQTIFSPLSIFTFLTGHNPYPGVKKLKVQQESEITLLIKEKPAEVKKVLEKITECLERYVDELFQDQTIDGIFYSIFGHGDRSELSTEAYQEFSSPYDNRVLERIKKNQGINLFHTCGPSANPAFFSDNEWIDIIHWADQEVQNPSLKEAKHWAGSPMAAGGVNQALFQEDKTELIKEQAQNAIDESDGRVFILTGGCGLPIKTNEASLWALRNSVNEE